MRSFICLLFILFGFYADSVIAKRRKSELERAKLQQRLEKALTSALSGHLPICARCKSIRKESGSWEPIETYIRNHSETDFTHTLCEGCTKELYPELEQ
jgi:hypothetical protein